MIFIFSHFYNFYNFYYIEKYKLKIIHLYNQA